MYTLLFLNPGHFHAALTLRLPHALVNRDVFVYAEEGPDLESFLGLARSFNQRAKNPTNWNLIVHTGSGYLERLITDRKGAVVIVAGKNDSKIESVARLHEAGFHVLADKPWLVGIKGLGALERATSGGALVMDIMTGRFEITHILSTRLTAEPEIFGGFSDSSEVPAVSMVSIHHLYKTVNGLPLVRPGWYFDSRVQGDGIVDIPSHLVDKLLWMMGEQHWDYERDVKLNSARLWDSEITPEIFTKITKAPAYPDFLSGDITDGLLHYRCNGEFGFDLRGIPVLLRAEWHQEAPPGGGDTYEFRFQGAKSQIAVEMGPQSGFQPRIIVRPPPGQEGVGQALKKTLASWQEAFPGLVAVSVADGYELQIPPQLKSTHEEHFSMVLGEFLDYLHQGAWPPQLANQLRTKYTITAQASELARKDQGS